MDAQTIGQRVAELRLARGLSRKALADRVGKSTHWLQSIEIGRRVLDSYSLMGALAAALEVDIAALTRPPQAATGTREQQTAHLAVPLLRRTLFRAEIGLPGTGTPTPLGELRTRVDEAHRFRRHARYGDLGSHLPELLDDAANAAALFDGAGRERAYGLLAEARHDAAMWAKRLGHVDLAGMAAVQALRAARKSGDPLLVTMAVWTQAEVYITAGAIGEAHELTTRTIDELDGHLGENDTGAWALKGTMHLVEAVIQAQWQRRQDAATHLMEGAAAASRTGESNAYELDFGPANRAIHGMHVGLELGDGTAVLALLTGVDLSGLPKERRARVGIERARAHAQAKDDVAAMEALLKADKIAPEAVRNHVLTREMTAVALKRSRVPQEAITAMVARVGT